jgi:hypothetical protein
MAVSKSGQSTWSDNTNPRSTFRLRRVPRIAIHPEAIAIDGSENRSIHGVD